MQELLTKQKSAFIYLIIHLTKSCLRKDVFHTNRADKTPLWELLDHMHVTTL